MPTYDTPQPISVDLEVGVAAVRIEAGERPDTVVEVRPSNAARKSDVAAAERTRVEFANGVLVVKAPPKSWGQLGLRGGSIDVRIELPVGSEVRGEGGVAPLQTTGRLGECRYKTGVGDITVEEAGPVRLRTGAGDIALGRGSGLAEITTGTGTLRIGSVDGPAAVKNSNGQTTIGAVTGDLRVSASNGRIVVDRADATVAAKTANGDIRLGCVSHGAVVAQTALGTVDIGVAEGVAAWLDLHTSFGHAESELAAAGRPEPGTAVVEVKARTSMGDITVRRAATALT
jgi:Putative adhesin